MSKYKNDIYILLGLGLFAWFIWVISTLDLNSGVHYHNYPKIDSVDKVKHIDVNPNIDPVEKNIEKTVDKPARKKAESSTIITGVEYDKKKEELDIQTIDTSGRKSESKFKLDPENTGFKSDTTGVEEKKKTKVGLFIKKFGKTALRVGEAALVGILIIKAVK
jgi:hypothetical protein